MKGSREAGRDPHLLPHPSDHCLAALISMRVAELLVGVSSTLESGPVVPADHIATAHPDPIPAGTKNERGKECWVARNELPGRYFVQWRMDLGTEAGEGEQHVLQETQD